MSQATHGPEIPALAFHATDHTHPRLASILLKYEKSHHSVNGWLSDPPLVPGGEHPQRRDDMGIVTGRLSLCDVCGCSRQKLFVATARWPIGKRQSLQFTILYIMPRNNAWRCASGGIVTKFVLPAAVFLIAVLLGVLLAGCS
jgi:hypothetical protein